MSPYDYIEPVGHLQPELFPLTEEERQDGINPAVKLAALLSGWIADAQERTPNEQARSHWVYHRAYAHIVARVHGGAMRLRVDGGDTEVAFDKAQLLFWRTEADRHLRLFERASLTSWPRVHSLR